MGFRARWLKLLFPMLAAGFLFILGASWRFSSYPVPRARDPAVVQVMDALVNQSHLRHEATQQQNQSHLRHKATQEKNESHLCHEATQEQFQQWLGQDILSEKGVFYRTLKRLADKHNTIFLASVDSSFVDMAVNMADTSFRPLAITNFLYVCSDRAAVEQLHTHGLECFLYEQNGTATDRATSYGDKDFILKMRVKMKMVTAALTLGFTVVLTDLDLVFFADPRPALAAVKADIALMSDVVMDNCGFYIARPTDASLTLHRCTLTLCMTKIIADQDAISQVIKSLLAKHSLSKKTLPVDQFPCGLVFYETGKRMFASDKPCGAKSKGKEDTCPALLVHNNWIVGKPAKIYRFKEMGTWMYDHLGYYSNPSRQYLLYDNPYDFGKENKQREKEAILTALTVSHLLNRTLILPKFHCQGCTYGPCKIASDHCAFNSHFHVKSLDEHFSNAYREHVFLNHSLVPAKVKESLSPQVFIPTHAGESQKRVLDRLHLVVNATDFKGGTISKEDVVNRLGSKALREYSVLRLHSLYLKVTGMEQAWTEKLKKAVRWSDYRQYKAWN